MKWRSESYISRRTFSIMAVMTMLFLLFVTPVSKAQEDSATYFDANFPAQLLPDGGEVIENNIADTDSVSTEISVWENDLGKNASDGSYVGSIFESSTFEFDYKPLIEDDSYTHSAWIYLNNSIQWTEDKINNQVWYENDKLDTFEHTFDIAKKRSIVNIATNLTFENNVIMSGATEFWVKLPVKASSINFDELVPTVSFIEMNAGEVLDGSDIQLEDGYRLIYKLYPSYTEWDIENEEHKAYVSYSAGNLLDRYGGFEQIRVSYKGRDPVFIQPIQEKYVINDNVYARVFATVEPNTNYAVVFSAMYKDKPKFLLTEDDICYNGRKCIIQTNDIEFDTKSEEVWECGVEQFFKTVLNVSTSGTLPTATPDSNIDIPVDPAFSFIFKAGRGSYGMYGQYFEMKQNQSLVFYRDIDFSSYGGDKFISVNIPFISDESIRANVTVELLPCGQNYNKFNGQGMIFTTVPRYDPVNITTDFGYVHSYWWGSDEPLTFNDYILFTVPEKVDYETLVEPVITAKIMITFVEDVSFTLMFSTIDPTVAYEKVLDVVGINADRTYISGSWGVMPNYAVRKHLTYIFDNTVAEPFYHNMWAYEYNFYNGDSPQFITKYSVRNFISNPQECDIVHAELFSSVQLTDGIWHQLVTTEDGFQYATHFFERRVAVGLVELFIDTTDTEVSEKESWWNESLNHFNNAIQSLQEGDILGAIKSAVASGISFLWNGLQEFLGVISSTFHKAWDWLVGVGRFIKSVLVSFVGQVLSIVGDIVDNLEKILEPALYIIALLIFMYVIAWSGKLIYNPTGGL